MAILVSFECSLQETLTTCNFYLFVSTKDETIGLLQITPHSKKKRIQQKCTQVEFDRLLFHATKWGINRFLVHLCKYVDDSHQLIGSMGKSYR